MLENFLKITIRNISNQKAYSFINLAGLTLGLTITLMIAFYVIDDLTFDRFHEDPENIYRVLTLETTGSNQMTYSITAGPLIPATKENIPEIIAATRAYAIGRPPVAAGDVPRAQMNETNSVNLQGFLTEPAFFDVFSFKLLEGDRENALIDPNGILLTPEAGERLFPEGNPIGQQVTVPGMQEAYVIGLVESPPANSHIQFEFIRPLLIENNPVWWDSWENFMLQGYLRVQPGVTQAVVEEKMLALSRSNNMPEINAPALQPLLDVHLGSGHHRYDGSNRGKNDRSVVYALSIIGILILIVAAVNFVNLSSARASTRAREVGMRKVLGSQKAQLMAQFLGESVFLCLIAMVISVVLFQLFMPQIESVLGKQLEYSFLENPSLLLVAFLVAIVIGLLSGLYPSLILSSFKPITVLKGKFHRSNVGIAIRKVLVLFQFAVTIALIVAVFAIFDQIQFLKSMDLGYSRDQVVTLFAPNNSRDLLRDRIATTPGVVAVGRSSGILGGDFVRFEVIPEGSGRENGQMFQQLAIDGGFFEALEIEIASGRNFEPAFTADTSSSIVINETAAAKIGWDDAIGKRLDFIEIDGTTTSKTVVGVVKDFHFTNTRQQIEPLFFQLNSGNAFLFSVKLSGGQVTEALIEIEAIYQDIYPDRNFNFRFLDELFDQQFQNDRDFAANIAYFSAIAIMIACLGLVGLVAYSVSQRKAEIAIRKVLGSGEGKIVFLLAEDFLKWVLIANLIAWPLSYYAVSLWLQGFAYRVSLTATPFILAGVTVLTVAMATMSFQSIKAALANPVDSLRNE